MRVQAQTVCVHGLLLQHTMSNGACACCVCGCPLQDKTLGPFLHQLSPLLGDNHGASKAQAEQEAQLWQVGRTRVYRVGSCSWCMLLVCAVRAATG